MEVRDRGGGWIGEKPLTTKIAKEGSKVRKGSPFHRRDTGEGPIYPRGERRIGVERTNLSG